MQQTFKPLLTTLAVAALLFSIPLTAADKTTKIGVVSFKSAVEKSKVGKQEQDMYESMKKQIETILQEKDEEFQKLTKKLKDDDFRDSQKPEALEKMEEQYRQLGQELGQAQSQYYQTLQQANYKIIQNLAETVSKASENVAKAKNFDLILNDDQTFYNSKALDVTDDVVAEMDKISAEQLKEAVKNSAMTPETKK